MCCTGSWWGSDEAAEAALLHMMIIYGKKFTVKSLTYSVRHGIFFVEVRKL